MPEAMTVCSVKPILEGKQQWMVRKLHDSQTWQDQDAIGHSFD
jgi:hypothetical protein